MLVWAGFGVGIDARAETCRAKAFNMSLGPRDIGYKVRYLMAGFKAESRDKVRDQAENNDKERENFLPSKWAS